MNHGTITAYKRYGCRCERCRSARSSYDRAWRARQGQKLRDYKAFMQRLYRKGKKLHS